MPIDHVKLPISDIDASRAFYSAALAPFGYRLVYDEDPGLGFGRGDGSDENEPFDLLHVGRPSIPSHAAIADEPFTLARIRVDPGDGVPGLVRSLGATRVKSQTLTSRWSASRGAGIILTL